jgi:hypothetical protein
MIWSKFWGIKVLSTQTATVLTQAPLENSTAVPCPRSNSSTQTATVLTQAPLENSTAVPCPRSNSLPDVFNSALLSAGIDNQVCLPLCFVTQCDVPITNCDVPTTHCDVPTTNCDVPTTHCVPILHFAVCATHCDVPTTLSYYTLQIEITILGLERYGGNKK